MENYVKDYCKESSIHGFSYIVKRDIHIVEKTLWTISLLISFVCCGLLIFEIGLKFHDDAIVTFKSDTAIAVKNVSESCLNEASLHVSLKIPFPAVTFCPDLKTFNHEFDYNQILTALKQHEITISNVTNKQLV
jgi:amiloride-sensitive sodium channel